MMKNLSEYFKPEIEIFLDTISYERIESIEGKEKKSNEKKDMPLLCQDNIKASTREDGVRIIVTRTLNFDPQELFVLSVSFGADLKFNEQKTENNWEDINLAEEFGKNGNFIIDQLMSRASLLIGQITSSFGQYPIILPPVIGKKEEPD